MNEVRWQPRHKQTLLVAPLDGQGFDRGGIFVPEDTRRNRMIGYVLATKDCLEVQPDDVVFYEEGAAETLLQADGEVIAWLHEGRCTAVDDELWPKPKEEQTLASGLILPGRD